MSPSSLQLIPLLLCPVTGESLSELTDRELWEFNRQILNGNRLHRDGTPVRAGLEAAVGTASRGNVYRVEEDIFCLLGDLSIVAATGVTTSALAAEKRVVQSFYDEFGWVKSASGLFNDTAKFTDVRDVAQSYRIVCNARIARLLPGGGWILDVASGAVPHPEYLDFSRDYKIRICVDFSIRALREARAKLRDRGCYILGDITRLPLAAGAVDTVISLHTIYHVPENEQTSAVEELLRVCRPGGRVIVVYTWANSPAMEIVFRFRGWLGWLKRAGRPPFFPASPHSEASPQQPALYYRPKNFEWYRSELASRHPARLAVWSAVNTPFQHRFFSNDRLGRFFLWLVIRLEQTFPGLAGRYGQYPMFIFDRPDRH